jgi:hypothetical protein
VIAQRIVQSPIFAPQQNDYVAKWAGAAAQAATNLPRPAWMRAAKAVSPEPVRRAIRKVEQRPGKLLAIGFERRFFKAFDPTAEREWP